MFRVQQKNSSNIEDQKMKERRAHNRNSKPVEVRDTQTVWFEVKSDFAPLAKKAAVLDLSETGMGLATDSPLETGQFVKFVKKQKKIANQLPESGIVMWTLESSDGFRAGVKFVG